jgi:hypothetical protein
MLNNPALLALFLQLWEPGFDSFALLPDEQTRLFSCTYAYGMYCWLRMAFCGQLTLQNGEMNAVFFDRTR